MSATIALTGHRQMVGKRFLFSLLAAVMIGLIGMFGTTSGIAHADDAAKKTLSVEVRNAVASKTYEKNGGGSLKGSELLTKNDEGTYVVNSDNYKELDTKGQNDFAADVISATNTAVKDGNKTGVNKDTKTNWFKDLQKEPGFGSKILNDSLNGLQPDFVSGAKIFQPFSGLISTAMGLGAIAIMAFFGLGMVIDIAFITIPMLRMVMGDSDGGGAAGAASKIVSNEAVQAVQASEQGGGGMGGDGKGKNAIMYYITHRAISMVFLGIAMVYLINGQLWSLVGVILDLMHNAFGF